MDLEVWAGWLAGWLAGWRPEVERLQPPIWQRDRVLLRKKCSLEAGVQEPTRQRLVSRSLQDRSLLSWQNWAN